MSVRRFIGYFIALSACSTIAFALSGMGYSAVPDAQETESSFLPPLPCSPIHLHSHKSGVKQAQSALTE